MNRDRDQIQLQSTTKMAKRGAASELNDRNWDQEEEPEEAGTFVQASSDVMQSRVVKRARRRGHLGEEEGSKPAVFGGFGGFTKSSSAAKSGDTGTSVGSGISFGGKPVSFGGASSLNGADDQKAKGDARDSSSYLHALKSLNESVLAWIKQHVEENPYIFLTPIFKDYQTHLEAIEAKRSPQSPAAGGQKESKNGDNNSSGTTKPSLSAPTSFQFSSSKPESSPAKDTKDESEKSKPLSFGLTTTTTTTETETKPSLFGGLSSSNGGFQFSTSSSTPGFAFSGNTSGASASSLGKPSFSFGATSSGFGSAGSSSMFAGASSQGSSQSTDTKDDEEYVPPKPEVREIKEDDALYSKRCKLYYQRDGQWVDRGVGNLHLKPVDETKTQLLIRADTNLGNILLNVMLATSMPVTRQGKNNVFLVCVPNPAINSKGGEEETTPVPMLIRVKTGEDADELFGKIEERKKLLS